MFLNLSNHPSDHWAEKQLAAAGDKVMDMPFPLVAPDGTEAYIEQLANEYLQRIMAINNVAAVHIMGEMNFTFSLINKLKAKGIKCVASTTKRIVTEVDGQKISTFEFVRFREY